MVISQFPRPVRAGRTLTVVLIPCHLHHSVKHIKRVDGLTGCYRGLTPKLVGSIVGVVGSQKILDRLGLEEVDENEDKDECELTDAESQERFCKSLKRELILHASGIIIAHPFQVISVRMMAQFVGKETIYRFAVVAKLYHTHHICVAFNFVFDLFRQFNVVVDQRNIASGWNSRILLGTHTKTAVRLGVRRIDQRNMLRCEQILCPRCEQSYLLRWIHSIRLLEFLVSAASCVHLYDRVWFKVWFNDAIGWRRCRCRYLI